MSQVYGNRWRVVRPLGEGGQAHVYLVTEEGSDGTEQFVLKRLKNVARLDRFRREIDAIRSLDHPGILRLVDANLEAEKPYLVTEFCAGGSLAEKDLAELSTLQRLRLFGQIAEAIAYAHGKGVVHRDLKPENMFLRTADGPAVVGDFGLCFVEDGERHTLLDEGVGSRFFIAPELEDGKAEEISPRGDVYSLGKVLYWLMSSKRRFAREKHRTDANDLVRLTGDRRLEQVNRLLDQMITENPTTRLENASSVVAALQETTPLIEGGFNVLSRNSVQRCTYCGRGRYGQHATKHRGVSNFGLNLVGDPDWRILVCDVCGHVQLFRLDLAKERDWI